ncbi:IclR family transcriptional regulator [Afifella sp. IM 167]|nr:IclR family transcriptional regulator [Afifella sp. IM 167]
MQPGEADPRLLLQSVERALHVLEIFGSSGPPLTLSQIAARAGIDKSAAQRIAHTLLHLGYLERHHSGTGFTPGRRVLDRAFDYLISDPLIERATPVLLELRKTARERVDLSLFDHLTIVYAVRLQSKRENFPATLIGRRIPTFCSSGGRAMMAHLEDEEVEDIIARSERKPLTPKTITEPGKIRAKIAEARRDGYALAREESLLGEIVLATAITEEGRPVAAIHIAGSLGEWTVEEFTGRFGPLAIEAARALHR